MNKVDIVNKIWFDKKSKMWISHCKTFDIMTCGESREDAIQDTPRMIYGYIEVSLTKNGYFKEMCKDLKIPKDTDPNKIEFNFLYE